MTKTELKAMGEDVRKQGRPETAPARTLSDLVYDLDTGEFTCVRGNESRFRMSEMITRLGKVCVYFAGGSGGDCPGWACN